MFEFLFKHKSTFCLYVLAVLVSLQKSSVLANPILDRNSRASNGLQEGMIKFFQSKDRSLVPRRFEAGEEMSQGTVEKELSDPTKEWNRVKTNPDFLLMNGDEQELRQRRQAQLLKRKLAPSQSGNNNNNNNNLALLEALLLSGRPLYYDLPDQEEMNLHQKSKRGKMMRLSLTDNIDVLREKLFMEIARRERLLNQEQVSMANANLVNIG